MQETRPLISTIIPVYNGELYIQEAVQSVLDQTYPEVEIIIVDDGSTDGTSRIVRGFGAPIRYIFQENAGPSAARNKGIASSCGGYLAFLDADDLFMPEKLEKQLLRLQEDPDLDMVFGQVEQFYSPDLSDEEKKRFTVSKMKLPGIFPSAMLIRRAAFERVGFFDTRLRVGQFLDWYMKAMETGLTLYTLDDVVVKRRIHRSNMTSQSSQGEFGDLARLIKSGLDRRRKKGTG
jgi:glycosyltransferase involved in cell wall biosynthesis